MARAVSPETAVVLIQNIQEILGRDGYGIFATDVNGDTSLWVGRIDAGPQFDEDDIYVMDVSI